MQAKWIVIAAAVAYHHGCVRVYRQFDRGVNARSHIWYRWFNEIPVVLLLTAVVLVVVKPL
jgi:putative membrane protein